ncbi:hypothetical protein FM104_10020 [Microbacterium esteraromaticum]|uniref:DUF58 domain-containing protein n=1 Tax=Microbacterium esteraromaticum TaxID=57043 RepID=A0A1R4K1P0_9MICO|nr:DUF58 domain-containing protein [Microbacterium esteraromaticum]SJN38260.1 hypothetical protein FM104_10020 [Microbacterium esteraromaticum]
MQPLITQVKSKLFIRSSQKSMHALDGAYASLMRGRSLDFEDLRPYEYGDQVRDIDWRATAKQGEPLIKRTKATRMHTVLFLVDAGRGMNALAEDETSKRELAVLVTGALGFLTVRHGDDFSVVYGDAEQVRRLPPGGSEGSLEHALRTIDRTIRESTTPNDRDALLNYVARNIARRMIVVIVTDEAPLTSDTDRMLRRLKVQHDVLWLTIRDADPVVREGGGAGRRDVDSGWAVPGFVQGDDEVLTELAAQEAAETARRHDLLRRLEITHAEFGGQDAAVPALLAMLNRRSNARL